MCHKMSGVVQTFIEIIEILRQLTVIFKKK